MSIRKIKSKNGKTIWELRDYLYGRGSKRIKRRFDSKLELDLFFENYLIEKRRMEFGGGSTISASELTFKSEAENWLSSERHRFSQSYLKSLRHFLKRLNESIGHIRIEQLHHAQLSKIQSDLLSRKLKHSSANRYIQVILAVLNFSVRHRRIPLNPALGFQKLKETNEAVGFWERSEAESFLEFVNQKYPQNSGRRWIYVVYLVALNTGARAGEIWALRPSDLEREMLLIQRQFNTAVGDFSTTKGKKFRKVPCNSALLSELKTLISNRKIKNEETIFQTENRKPISHDNFVKRQFLKDIREWGGRRIRFHDLRHSASTLMIAAGVDLKTVQEICGHSNIKTTMNYVHLLSERIQETARMFSILPTSISAIPSMDHSFRVIQGRDENIEVLRNQLAVQ